MGKFLHAGLIIHDQDGSFFHILSISDKLHLPEYGLEERNAPENQTT